MDCQKYAIMTVTHSIEELLRLFNQLKSSSCLPSTSKTVWPIDTFEECSSACNQVATIFQDMEKKLDRMKYEQIDFVSLSLWYLDFVVS